MRVERGDDWRDVSVHGDPWEVQFNAAHSDMSEAGAFRYRSACLGHLRTDWAPGKPPTGFYAEKEK